MTPNQPTKSSKTRSRKNNNSGQAKKNKNTKKANTFKKVEPPSSKGRSSTSKATNKNVDVSDVTKSTPEFRPEKIELTPREGIVVYASLLTVLTFFGIFSLYSYKIGLIAQSNSGAEVDLLLPSFIFIISIIHFVTRLIESYRKFKKEKLKEYEKENREYPTGC